ncbi:MAG: YidC/Oxa1 family rane protein insertase [Actinomycetota bacterium]|nr:YidC/Oxa1 family rane protein insertase [Actinomycetota bacterium]
MNGLIALIATPVATVLKGIHTLLSTFLAPSSGPAWGLSIVLLTVCVRLVLFPLFVKQIKSQRRMQELAPKIKELQARHKGDRETLNTELMKLYKDNNANPISGCLPLILQLPVFFALFSVIREFKPGAHAKYGLSADDLHEGGRASIFGAPISAAFNSSTTLVHQLGGSLSTVRVIALVMIVLMGGTTFWTQRQMMARAGAAVDKQQQQIQKFMLYVLPLSFAVFGINFPIGVLLYWLTTNVWSMGQQHYVIKRMPPVVPGSGGPGKGGSGGGKGGPGKGGGPGGSGKGPAGDGPAGDPDPAGPTAAAAAEPVLTASGAPATRATAARPADRRSSGSRKNKKRGRR